MEKISEQEFERLLRQSVIVSTMMLTVLRMMQGDYRRKHLGAVTTELLIAFVFWRDGEPRTVLGAAREAGIPENTARRAVVALTKQGLLKPHGRLYCRDADFIRNRMMSEYFVGIRVEVMKAGDALHLVWDKKKPRR